MPSDDMHLIICKILGYIYYCNRNDIKVQEKDIVHKSKLFDIPYNYWCQIMSELMSKEYINGIKIVKDVNGTVVTIALINPIITSVGVGYFNENKRIQRALKYLQEIKSTLPFV